MAKLSRSKRKSYLPNSQSFDSNQSTEKVKFYNSTSWRKISTNYRKDQPLCEVSKSKGLTVEASEVDHIIPVEQGGAKYDPSNLMAMCKSVHMKKTGMESHKPILVAWMLNHDGDKVPVKRDEVIVLLNSNN